MTPLEQQITELALAYQWAIREEHHKDRDCHFSVVKQWSYGEAPKYRVEHEGYLHEWGGPLAFRTAEAAQTALVAFLAAALEDIKTWEDHDDPA